MGANSGKSESNNGQSILQQSWIKGVIGTAIASLLAFLFRPLPSRPAGQCIRLTSGQ